ncbi:MAG: DNA polymerase III subunit delta' [Elusimicrobia bacterium]|nr:DNA polymerase III subunit delta' [Elusimicrobiota bacterium]
MSGISCFGELKGQDEALGMLRQYLKSSRMPSGLIFCGPEGVGKKTAAVLTAKALNCLSAANEPCGQCASCLKIEKGEHPDVHLIENDQDAVKSDDIRALRREIFLKPYEGKKRVFIIDNAHKLTAEAANSILKVLEEPPEGSIIILVTSCPSRLLKTVLSRCQSVRFRRLTAPVLEALLRDSHGVDAQTAGFLSSFSCGSPGAALKMQRRKIVEERDRAVDYFLGKGPDISAGLKEREDAKAAMTAMAAWLRDVILLKTGVPESRLVNYDRRRDAADCGACYTTAELLKAFRALADSLLFLEQNVNVKLLVSGLRMESCIK